jgi:hypothetical protein
MCCVVKDRFHHILSYRFYILSRLFGADIKTPCDHWLERDLRHHSHVKVCNLLLEIHMLAHLAKKTRHKALHDLSLKRVMGSIDHFLHCHYF